MRGKGSASKDVRRKELGLLATLNMKELLEAGVHFGHQTRRWNPKMKKFIYGARNGIYIIDLHSTLRMFDDAQKFIQDVVQDGRHVLFVGTKKQAQEAIKEAASRSRQYYVNHRWLGGMLTNYNTLKTRIDRMKEIEKMRDSGDLEKYPKKEANKLLEQREKLAKNLDGIRDMPGVPGAVFIVDLKKEHIALAEARKLGIPVVAIVDTNCDPDLVDHVIPGNDDAIRAIKLISFKLAEAICEVKEVEWQGAAVVDGDGMPAEGTGEEARGDIPVTFRPVEDLSKRDKDATERAAEDTGTSSAGGPPAEGAKGAGQSA
jgi:small subunit ribosomal protein S2